MSEASAMGKTSGVSPMDTSDLSEGPVKDKKRKERPISDVAKAAVSTERAAKRVKKETLLQRTGAAPMEVDSLGNEAVQSVKEKQSRKIPAFTGPAKGILTKLEKALTNPEVLTKEFFDSLEATLLDHKLQTVHVSRILKKMKEVLEKEGKKEGAIADLQDVYKHTEMLRSPEFEKKPMKVKEALQIATCLKNTMLRVDEIRDQLSLGRAQYFPKEETGLARDLAWKHKVDEQDESGDTIMHSLSVISQQELGKGTTKVASTVLTQNVIACAQKRISHEPEYTVALKLHAEDVEQREKDAMEVDAEENIEKLVYGESEEDTIAFIAYEDNLPEGTGPQRCKLVRHATPLDKLPVSTDANERLEQAIDMASQMACITAKCEKLRIGHLDIKPENINVYIDKKGVLRVKIADWGKASEPKKRHIDIAICDLRSYGSAPFSPPELYLNNKFKEDLVKWLKNPKKNEKVILQHLLQFDRWAKGAVLWGRYFGTPHPGAELINRVEDNCCNDEDNTYDFSKDEELAKVKGKKPEQVIQEKFKEEIDDKVEKPLAKLLKKEKRGQTLSRSEHFEKYIFSLMRKEGTDRIDAAEEERMLKALPAPLAAYDDSIMSSA